MHIIEIAKELEKYDWYEKNLYFKFTDYPDIVNLTQMRKMLGGISNSLAYRMLREKKIKSKKVGREYKIPKVNVIKYVMTEQ